MIINAQFQHSNLSCCFLLLILSPLAGLLLKTVIGNSLWALPLVSLEPLIFSIIGSYPNITTSHCKMGLIRMNWICTVSCELIGYHHSAILEVEVKKLGLSDMKPWRVQQWMKTHYLICIMDFLIIPTKQWSVFSSLKSKFLSISALQYSFIKWIWCILDQACVMCNHVVWGRFQGWSTSLC